MLTPEVASKISTGKEIYVDSVKHKQNGWYAFRVLLKKVGGYDTLVESEAIYPSPVDAQKIGLRLVNTIKVAKQRGLTEKLEQ